MTEKKKLKPASNIVCIAKVKHCTYAPGVTPRIIQWTFHNVWGSPGPCHKECHDSQKSHMTSDRSVQKWSREKLIIEDINGGWPHNQSSKPLFSNMEIDSNGGFKNKFRCTPAFSFLFGGRGKEPTGRNTDLLNGVTLYFPVVWKNLPSGTLGDRDAKWNSCFRGIWDLNWSHFKIGEIKHLQRAVEFAGTVREGALGVKARERAALGLYLRTS